MPLDGATIRAAIDSASPDEPFSGVVRVQEGDTVVFQKGFGLANRADAIPNTATTRFGTASGSKIFTAVAVLQLVQERKLTLGRILSALAQHWTYTLVAYFVIGSNRVYEWPLSQTSQY